MKVSSIVGLAIVPVALALGALYWLFFVEDTHDFGRRLDREKRDAFAVHAVPAPKAKIIITMRPSLTLIVEGADQDGSRLVAYVRNVSHRCIPFVKLHFKETAPDGTVVAADEKYQDGVEGGISPGQRAEIIFDNVPEDNRAASIEVWASGETYDCE